jgi:hypothetical protein
MALQASDPFAKRGPVPKKKAAPKRKKAAPKRPSGAGIAGVSVAVAKRQTAPKKVVARTQKAGRPAPKRAPAPAGSRSLEEAFAKLGVGREPKKAPGRDVETGGLERLNLLRGDGEGGGLGNFLGNFGGDVMDVATGLPSAGQLVGENLAAFNPVTMTGRGLHEAGVPGLGWTKGFQKRVAKMDKQAAEATVADYKYRYGPFVQGDFGKGWERVQEHPGFFASDVAGLYSAAGSAARMGAKAGALATGSQRLARVASRATTPGSVRYRKPKTREMRMGENSPAVAKVTVRQRPYSANPMTRSVQKGAGKLRQRVARAVDEAVDNGNTMLAPLGRDAKFKRAAGRGARNYRLSYDMEMHRALRQASRGLTESVSRLDKAGVGQLRTKGKSKWTREQVDAALWLHAKDLLDAPGKTPRQALNAVVSYMREGQGKTPRRRTTGANQTIETLHSLPDELLDLKAGPPELRAAVSEYRRISEEATQKRIQAGAIAPETAQAVRVRPAQSVHAGVAFDYDTGKWTSPRNPYSNIGKRGVYVQDVPRDPLKKGKAGDPSGAFGRMTQDKVRQSHGTLMRSGNVRMDRGLPLKALERALVDEKHPLFVEDFYKTFAFRESNANITKGRRAVLAMEADPDSVVLLSRKSLDDAMRLSKELPEGELPDSPLRGVELYEGNEGLARVRELGDRADDLIAFPKAAVEGMREGWQKIAGGQVKGFDTVQALWRRGILAFAPRYYLNSLIGNLGQYVMLTGGDLRSLRQARRMKLGDNVPEVVSGSTNVAEARIGDPRWSSMTLPGKKLARMSDRLMDWQGSFDALYRRAAYINRVKRGLKDEGKKIRGLSAEDLGEAIRTAPKEVIDEAARTTNLFFGDYLRLTPVERATLRRIFPFWSFLKFSSRFLIEMPIRHPKRAALLAIVSQAAQETVNPLDPLQDNLANRGMLRYGDKFAQRTTGMNTQFAPADILRGLTSRDPQAVIGGLADTSSPIGLQQILRNYSGTGAFGVPVSAPPGYNGSFSEYGGPLMRIDPTTGRPSYYNPTVPLSEQVLQTIPLLPQVARGVLSGPDRPYDTTTTLDLFNYRFGGQGDRKDLFREKRDRAMEPVPWLGPLFGWAGANVQRYDRAKDIEAIKRSDAYAKKAKRSTAKRRKKLKP